MASRTRWLAFRDFVDRTRAVTDAELDELLADFDAEPDAWLRRACIVTLVRDERGPLTDAQLRTVAARYPGKIAAFIATVLARRAT